LTALAWCSVLSSAPPPLLAPRHLLRQLRARWREEDYTKLYCILQSYCSVAHHQWSKKKVSFRFLPGARRLQVAADPGVRRLERVGRRHARHPVLPGRGLLLRGAGGEGRRGSLQGAPVACQALRLQEVRCSSEGGERNRCAAGGEEGTQEALRERAAQVEAQGSCGRGPVQDLPAASLQGEEEEAAEEFAWRVPRLGLHRLIVRDAELNKFLESSLAWCSGESCIVVYANMRLMETYYCFCTRLN
ncbi:hypothetical protein ACJX0J_017287, partial [Zea mays]